MYHNDPKTYISHDDKKGLITGLVIIIYLPYSRVQHAHKYKLNFFTQDKLCERYFGVKKNG